MIIITLNECEKADVYYAKVNALCSMPSSHISFLCWIVKAVTSYLEAEVYWQNKWNPCRAEFCIGIDSAINRCNSTLHLSQTDPEGETLIPVMHSPCGPSLLCPSRPCPLAFVSFSFLLILTSGCLKIWEVPKEAACVFLKSWITLSLQFHKWERKEAGEYLTEQVISAYEPIIS